MGQAHCGYALSQSGLDLMLSRWLPNKKLKHQPGKSQGRVVHLLPADMLALLDARDGGLHGGKVDCREAEGLITPGAARVISRWSDGGCVALCDDDRALGSPVAFSCFKSKGHWMQVRALEKEDAKAVRLALETPLEGVCWRL